MYFYSRSKKLTVPTPSGEMVNFKPNSSTGIFATDDKNLIDSLKESPYYGKDFSDKKINFGNDGMDVGIINGVRTSSDPIALREAKEKGREEMIAKIKEFNELHAEIVVKGQIDTKASKEKVEKFKSLKEELGI